MSWSFVMAPAGDNSQTKVLTGINNGDALFAVYTSGSPENMTYSPPTDDAGNTYKPIGYIHTQNDQVVGIAMAVHAGSNGATVTISMLPALSFQQYCAWAMRHSAGNASTNPPVLLGIDGKRIPNTGAGTDTIVSGSVDSYGADAALMGLFMEDGTGPAIGLGTGFSTILQDTGAPGFRVEWKQLSSPAANTVSFSPAGTAVGCVFAIAIGVSNDFPGVTSQEIAIGVDGDDGGGFRQGTTWGSIGTATFTADDGTTNQYIGDDFSSPNYTADQTYLRFNTGGVIPADAVVLWARLKININDNTHIDGEIYIGWDFYDFGGAPSVAADHVDPGSSAALEAACTVPPGGAAYLLQTTGFDATRVYTFHLNDVSGVKRSGEANAQGFSGYTGLRGSFTYPGAAPTGANYIRISTREHATSQEPRLEVGWYVPATAADPTFKGSPRRGLASVS